MTKRNARPATEARAERTKRVPISGQRDLLTVSNREEGWHYCFVNDSGSNVQEYIDAGYDFVQDPNIKVGDDTPATAGTAVSIVVERATGLKAYLMRQPQEFYDEDRAAESEHVSRSEETLFRQQREEHGRYGTIQQE